MVMFAGGYTLMAMQSGLLAETLFGKMPSIEFRATFTIMLLSAYTNYINSLSYCRTTIYGN
ncbi:MAG: hypothetical protein ACI9FJ_002653 [Alteromonadaceae bacterium]|jgi:hypothetical protein